MTDSLQYVKKTKLLEPQTPHTFVKKHFNYYCLNMAIQHIL